MTLAVSLSVVIGLALGLLGGGGSILTVPILVYAAGLPARSAIATSLLVVGVTSAVAVLTHARAGRVRWRTALLFGGAGMAGAYAGGQLARFIPAPILLLGFAAMMLVTAVAMLREPRGALAGGPPRQHRVGRILVEGAAVGLVTGLVGAGGGFLVVPALLWFGGLPMSAAIGTSLVVVSMKSFAGLAGYLGHVAIDWPLAALVSAAAAAGTVVGGRLAGRVPEAVLRKLFGYLVVAMAIVLVGRELPDAVRGAAVYQALLVARWPWWAGGLAIAAVVLGLLWYDNKLLGVSTGCAELGQVRRDPAARRSWRLPLLAGIVLGGLAAAALAGAAPTLALGGFDTLVSARPWIKLPVLAGAGLLIGYGARAAGGCTSGHGIVGTALGAPASWIATAAFMVAGYAVTTVAVLVLA